MINTAQQILEKSKKVLYKDGQKVEGYAALLVEVYRHRYSDGFVDCTNNGISKDADTLLLICPEGNYNTHEEYASHYPICRVEDHPTVKGHQYIVPCDKDGNTDGRWYVFGGNYARGDSRYSENISEHPLKIHDRVE